MNYRTVHSSRNTLELKLDKDLTLNVQSFHIPPDLIRQQLEMNGFMQYIESYSPPSGSKISVDVQSYPVKRAVFLLTEPGKKPVDPAYCGFYPARTVDELTLEHELNRVHKYLDRHIVAAFPKNMKASLRTFEIESDILARKGDSLDTYVELRIAEHGKRPLNQILAHMRPQPEEIGKTGYLMKRIAETFFLSFGEVHQTLRYVERQAEQNPQNESRHSYMGTMNLLMQKADQLYCMLLTTDSIPENSQITQDPKTYSTNLYRKVFLEYPKHWMRLQRQLMPHAFRQGAEQAFGTSISLTTKASLPSDK